MNNTETLSLQNTLLRSSRRDFLRVATLTTAGLTLGGLAARTGYAQTTRADQPLYRFPLLGDLHYDRMEHHDLDWVRKEKPGDERQMVNYSKVTETLTPGLFREVSAAVKASAAPVPFVVQVGDLVEGLCGSRDLAVRQFKDAFAAVENAAFGVPFLITKGNHDITGPGANQAYDDTLMPWIDRQVGRDLPALKGANYVRRQDEDLFVFFDCYVPDLDWLEAALKTNPARHVFVITHQPVVPYNARSNWIVFARAADAEKRARLLSLLGQYRAIVLGGHLHKFSALTRTTDRGPIVQLAVSSVLRVANEAAKNVISGRDHFGAALLETEPNFAPNTLKERTAVLENEASAITSFEYADVPGYAMVNVYADRVDADIFVGLSKTAWKSTSLKVGPTAKN